MQNLTSQHDVDSVVAAAEAILLKHGAHCPISARARDELSAFAASHPDLTVCALEVTANHDLSKYTADRLGIEHQSPQVFVIRAGKVAWHAAHYDITADDLTAQLTR